MAELEGERDYLPTTPKHLEPSDPAHEPVAGPEGGRGSWDYIWNLDTSFRSQLEAFIAASNGQVRLLSGYRSNDHQQDLYNQAIREHGAANAGKWAAPPGRSNHNHGVAGDLRYVGAGAKQWAHENAARFGLEFPMSHEPWHIEPVGLRTGDYHVDRIPIPGADSYTVPPPGVAAAFPVPQPLSIGRQLNRLLIGPVGPAERVAEIGRPDTSTTVDLVALGRETPDPLAEDDVQEVDDVGL